MPISDNRATGSGGGAVDSVNGQVGAVTITAQSLASSSELQEDCLDNATTYAVVGSGASGEKYEIDYICKLNVSGKKRTGVVRLAYDADEGAVIFDDEASYVNTDIAGLDLSADYSGGNLRLVITKLAVGENSKIRYNSRRIGQIV